MYRTSVLLLASLFLTACGPQLAQPDSAVSEDYIIRTATIDPNVSITDEPFVQTYSDLWAGVFAGGLGAAVADMDGTSEENFVALLKIKNIDLKEMVREAFKAQLSSPSSDIKFIESKGDVRIQLTILFYGIHPSAPFTSSIEPMLEVGAQVYDKQGNHIMNLSEAIKFPDNELVMPRELEEYASSPDLLKQSFQALSDKITNTLRQQLEYRY